jgi:hypothetical protein
MKTSRLSIAAVEVLLIFPAVLFMAALFIRSTAPLQYEPAHTAQGVVMWYAARRHFGLWVLLFALPLTALVAGSVTLMRNWRRDPELRLATRQILSALRAHLAMLLVAAVSVTAAGILAIVALHVLTD